MKHLHFRFGKGWFEVIGTNRILSEKVNKREFSSFCVWLQAKVSSMFQSTCKLVRRMLSTETWMKPFKNIPKYIVCRIFRLFSAIIAYKLGGDQSMYKSRTNSDLLNLPDEKDSQVRWMDRRIVTTTICIRWCFRGDCMSLFQMQYAKCWSGSNVKNLQYGLLNVIIYLTHLNLDLVQRNVMWSGARWRTCNHWDIWIYWWNVVESCLYY